MSAAFLIAGKDLRQRLRDRSAIVLSILAPFGLAFILGQLIPSSDETSVHRYGVVDQDGGQAARTFVTEVLGELDRDRYNEVQSVDSPAEATRLAEDNKIAAAFVIPEGFSTAAQSNGRADIAVIGNSETPIAASIARAIAESYAEELNAVRLSLATAAGGDLSGDLGALGQAAGRTTAPIALEEDAAARREFSSKTFTAAGMAVFFLFFTAQFGVLSLLAERRDGTMARLLGAPIPPAAIVVAKALSTFVLGIVSMSVLVVASSFLLGAEWGDPLGVGALIVAAVVSAMGLTSLVGGIAKTDEQAAGYSSIIAVTLGILGGTFFPISQGPGLLTKLSQLTPHYWLMRGFGDLSGGAVDVADVVLPVVALIAFGAVTGAIAMARARKLVLQA